MKSEKMKSLSAVSTEVQVPQKCKISFLLIFFGGGELLYNFINNFIVRFMNKDGGQLDFFLVISIANFAFSDKRNSNSKNFAHVSFCGPKVLTKF